MFYSNDHEQPSFNRELPVDFHEEGQVAIRSGMSVWFLTKWFVVFGLFLMSVVVGIVITKNTTQLPDIKVLESYRPNESTLIYDRDAKLIANIHGDEDRVVVDLKDISPYVKQAVLAIEDNRFYHHNGVDVRGTARAFMANMRSSDNVQGGSTITQQLVKNLFLSPEKSYKRKFAEAVLALRVEKHYSKDKILEIYLNQVYFGNLSYGIEKAARRYFKKSAKDLNLAESALLAGLLKAPEGLSPYTYPSAARRRQVEVLRKMLEYGYITENQYKKAIGEKIVLNSRQTKPSSHPYFVTYVIQELERTYGRDVVRRGGLKVYTTIDPVAQAQAEKVIGEYIEKVPKYTKVQQGAFVSMDVDTGEIIALVGGVHFRENQFNAATQSRRAVGSTFKPFVYLTGFRMEKITPRTRISDKPIRYGKWAPKNWDGKYMGAMDIRRALTLSRNTPTVQVGMRVGVEEVIKTAQSAGITSNIDPNSSSLLGSSGVSPLELVTAYSTLARGGVYIQPSAIKRVVDNRGRVVKIDTPKPKRVFDQDYVAAIVDILIDVVEKGTGRSARIPGRVIAGKTGTTDQVRDIWFIGFTPDVVSGVWLGHPKNLPLKGVFSFNAAQVWHDYTVHYYETHDVPKNGFFLASNEYAARAGLHHLLDPDGVAEARKHMKVETLSSKEDFVDDGEGEGDMPIEGTAAEAPTEFKPFHNIPPLPQASSGPRPIRRRVPQKRQVTEESPEEKETKYQRWEDTLDDLNKRLNE